MDHAGRDLPEAGELLRLDDLPSQLVRFAPLRADVPRGPKGAGQRRGDAFDEEVSRGSSRVESRSSSLATWSRIRGVLAAEVERRARASSSGKSRAGSGVIGALFVPMASRYAA